MLNVMEDLSFETLVIEPFPSLVAGRRGRVVGLDVWFEVRPERADGAVRAIVGALTGTPVRLTYVDDLQGRTVWPAADRAAACRMRARVMARDEDIHLTDAATAEVLATLAPVVSWSLVRTLHEVDGVEMFEPLDCATSGLNREEQR